MRFVECGSDSMARQMARSRAHQTVEDIDLIQITVRLLEDIETLHVVDLGAGSGTSAIALLECREPGSIDVTTCDIDQENLDWAALAVSNFGRTADWRGILSDSRDWSKIADPRLWWADYSGISRRQVDFLLIDTSHEYDLTVAEIQAWRGFLEPNTPIWFDDYSDEYPGVIQAVNEAVENGRLETVARSGKSVLTVTL